jgi:ribosomal protein L7/L12/cytoskeletal protein RodZ
MKEKKYRIIFKGEIIPNANLEEVKQKLAAFFKADIKEIESLFTGKNFVLKENVNLDAAQDYMYQLEQAGALCELVEMKSKSKKEPKKEPDSTAATPIEEKTPQTTVEEKERKIEKPVKEQTQYELRYQLLFKGETIHGKDINEVKTNLSMFYKVKPDKLTGLFTGKPVAVTPEPTDFWSAVAYLNRFHECGAVSYLETVESPETVGEKPGKYKIVFGGELQKGHDLLTLKTKLASMFKVSGLVIDKLFPGKPVLVKTDLDQDAAQAFKKNFETTGARCQVLKLSEKLQLPAPGVPARETEAPATQQPSVISPPPAAPRQSTYQPPRQLQKTGKKMNVLTLLVIAVAILAVFIIFKAISGKSTGEPETTPSTQTTTPPSTTTSSPGTRPSSPQPQPQSKTPSGSRLQAEPTKAFEDPLKYYSVSLPGGYIYINESKGKQSKVLFNYSANINVTITASPLTKKRDHQETMYAKVTEIESGNAGPLSRLSISSYDLVSFSGLEGFEIILERGTQLVHMYELVSPNNTAFSIIIVTIGDNNQENHDILDTALRESLRF